LRRDDPVLAAIMTTLGAERVQATFAVTARPFQ
jgi:hypothetical protein